MSRPMQIACMSALCAASIITTPTTITAFMPSITNCKSTTSTQQYLVKHSPLEDEPWQKDDSYWDQLQTASKDPEAFEKFIEESMKKQGKKVSTSAVSNAMHDTNGASKEDAAPKKKGKYVPIEQWDAERDPESMSAEERLQWECQRGGNQFRQNEILLHNLKSF